MANDGMEARMVNGWGGVRPNSGRKPKSAGERTINKSVTLTETEWEALKLLAEDGSATKEAARRIRMTFEDGFFDRKRQTPD